MPPLKIKLAMLVSLANSLIGEGSKQIAAQVSQ